MTNKLYAERDAMAQGQHYVKHVWAMTAEDLHSKAAIAMELAHRDIQIEQLTADLIEIISENSRLREGMKGDYDLDAWLAWVNEAEDSRSGQSTLHAEEGKA